MGWSDKTKIADALAVQGTELFSDSVTLKSDEVAHIQVDADFPGSPTDNLEIRIYTTLDDSTEAWDDTALETVRTIANTTDPNSYSFTVSNVYKFRLGFIRSGSTDEIATNAWYRSNGDYKDCHLDI
jgi:hypothetical protein